MIYYYSVRLRFFINDKWVLKDYRVSFCEIVDFLYSKKQKNSSMEVYSIKPFYKY